MKNTNIWLYVGFLGQLFFGSRFIVQWIASERKKQSFVPVVFWYLSLFGGLVLFSYAVHIKDPVFIFGQGLGIAVYVRNLMLIKKHKLAQNTSVDANKENSEAE